MNCDTITMQPSWVGDLLHQWALRDWCDVQRDLGYPRVSPAFARSASSAVECDDVTGYSAAEGAAMTAAVEWLQRDHPEHWRALARSIRAWSRLALEPRDGDDELVAEAGVMLAGYIDALLD